MILSFKTRIYPTNVQKEYFNQAFGIRRFTWNWALGEYLRSINEDNVYKTSYDLQKQLNNSLVKDDDYKWLNDVNSMVRQESLKDLGLSLKKFHDMQKREKATVKKVNTHKYKPKFKSKKYDSKSFRMNNKGNPFKAISKHYFTLTTTKTLKKYKIKCAESLLFLKNHKFCTCTINQEADKYYISITYEKINHKIKCKYKKTKIGIDMGIKNPLTCYNGKKGFYKKLPKNLKKIESRTERINRILSRKDYGSNNYKKLLIRLQRSYKREYNIKKDYREKLTTKLCETYRTINIETFTHSGARNLGINRALSRVGAYEFIERLKSKVEIYGNTLNIVEPFTPTTQTCSCCGNRYTGKDKLTLKDRTYECNQCNTKINRDLNAAINIYNYA